MSLETELRAMPDITDRLRRWSISTDALPASDIMEEAADEIDRLRLTDAEREAVEWFAEVPKPLARLTKNSMRAQYIATLRGLLERLK